LFAVIYPENGNRFPMMSYEQWLGRIVEAARDIADREFQREAWFPGGKFVSSPDEVYQVLMEDCTFDLFFQKYHGGFTEEQARSWSVLRSNLQQYYDSMPYPPDALRVLDDPDWDKVRRAAQRFVKAFAA
jgi:hypothetical protein